MTLLDLDAATAALLILIGAVVAVVIVGTALSAPAPVALPAVVLVDAALVTGAARAAIDLAPPLQGAATTGAVVAAVVLTVAVVARVHAGWADDPHPDALSGGEDDLAAWARGVDR